MSSSNKVVEMALLAPTAAGASSTTKAAQRREQRKQRQQQQQSSEPTTASSGSNSDVESPNSGSMGISTSSLSQQQQPPTRPASVAVAGAPRKRTSSVRGPTRVTAADTSNSSSSADSPRDDEDAFAGSPTDGLSSSPSSAFVSRNPSRGVGITTGTSTIMTEVPSTLHYRGSQQQQKAELPVQFPAATSSRASSLATVGGSVVGRAAADGLGNTKVVPNSPINHGNNNPNVVLRRPGEARRLYNFHEVPSHLQDNEFIHNYYRAHLTGWECAQSVFEIHNETGNIWTHLLGMIIYAFIWYWVQTDVIVPQHDGSEFIHRVQFTILIVSMMICLGASAFFHTMLAHSELWVFKLAHAIDYAGATCLIMGTFIPIIYYSFVCQTSLQIGYTMMACVMGIAGVVAPLIPWFEDEDKFFARMGIYAAIGASATIPLIHMCFATPLNHMTIPIYAGIFATFLISMIAASIYATHFPECFAPGRFDLWFSSHQVWHMLIFLGGIVQFFNGAALYQNWSIMKGKC